MKTCILPTPSPSGNTEIRASDLPDGLAAAARRVLTLRRRREAFVDITAFYLTVAQQFVFGEDFLRLTDSLPSRPHGHRDDDSMPPDVHAEGLVMTPAFRFTQVHCGTVYRYWAVVPARRDPLKVRWVANRAELMVGARRCREPHLAAVAILDLSAERLSAVVEEWRRVEASRTSVAA